MSLSTCHGEVLWRNGANVRTMHESAARGIPPAVVLCNPKYDYNVGGVVRAASCFGIHQVWFTGQRVSIAQPDGKKYRLPREERMKDYQHVSLVSHDLPFRRFRRCTPVAVELRSSSESLHDFEHPDDAVYVFGPEDGSIPKGLLHVCHRFVVIPSRHCVNLSQAVNIVLYDRTLKRERTTMKLDDIIWSEDWQKHFKKKFADMEGRWRMTKARVREWPKGKPFLARYDSKSKHLERVS